MKRLILMLCLFLCSCSPVRSILIPSERLPLNLSDPDPLELKDVSFVVIHKDNAQKIFSDLEKKGIEPVVFGLTGDDYKALASDMSDIKSYLKIQKQILILYRNYYEGKKANP